MDFLTHLFLPLAIVFVYRKDLATSTLALGLAMFGLLPDFDKFLGMQGLLHSLVTLIPICLFILAVEHRLKRELDLSPIILFLVGSHLLLDFIDGGPVPLLYPVIESGIGLKYPARLVFGEGFLGVAIQGPMVTIRTTIPTSGYSSFGFINGTGVLSFLTFLTILMLQRDWWPRPSPSDSTPTGGDRVELGSDEEMGK